MKARLLLPLLLLPLAAQADWFTGNLGLASDYSFRGLDQTNGLAAQGGLDYVHHSGLYAGAAVLRGPAAGVEAAVVHVVQPALRGEAVGLVQAAEGVVAGQPQVGGEPVGVGQGGEQQQR